MNATKNKLTYEQFCEEFPTYQSTHTGRWGWRRIAGCINLNSMPFRSQEAAEADRRRFWESASATKIDDLSR